jgi:hypothetical protein
VQTLTVFLPREVDSLSGIKGLPNFCRSMAMCGNLMSDVLTLFTIIL